MLGVMSSQSRRGKNGNDVFCVDRSGDTGVDNLKYLAFVGVEKGRGAPG